ncbi:MAG: hypothetical protein JSV88_22790 [Candidatus Aminicenantes bacterium]|nr:MAG: hypothetical protein JSV88_22790 [Candidatus Aminicenantes bacterium]
MQAIREIITAGADTVTIRIPEEFREKQVEIIVLPYAGTLPNNLKTDKLKQFDQLVENAKKRNLKIDKNINIDDIMNEMNNGLC